MDSLKSTRPAPPETKQVPSPAASRALELFLGYRVLVATLMVVLFFAIGRGPLGAHDPDLFSATLLAYTALTVAGLLFGLLRPGRPRPQAALAALVDILFLSVLMYASGGVPSGLGILIAIVIALVSNILERRLALALAAVASLAMIGEEILAQWAGMFPRAAHVQAGLLGSACFALVLLVSTISTRARRSEELAEQRENELLDLAQLNDHVIQQLQSGVVVVDREHIVQMMNQPAWILLGMPPQMRHYRLKEVSPQLAREFNAWLAGLKTADITLRLGQGGRNVRVRFMPLGKQSRGGTLILLEDMSVLTAQAQQMKLASLGRLTGGIAHEVRNPLGAISHAAQLLQESPGLDEAERRMIEIILHNSERVNEVIETILKLSRQDLPKPKPLVLGPWLAGQAERLRQACGLRPEQLEVRVEPEGTTVYADGAQLKQILEVLCDNARRHFAGPPGELRVRIRAGITPESGGPYLEVTDNGPGIPPDKAEHLFEPFFTTRNEGTGLGLYIARQLSEANRIRIEYRPLPEGSCFRLNFPNPKRPELA